MWILAFQHVTNIKNYWDILHSFLFSIASLWNPVGILHLTTNPNTNPSELQALESHGAHGCHTGQCNFGPSSCSSLMLSANLLPKLSVTSTHFTSCYNQEATGEISQKLLSKKLFNLTLLKHTQKYRHCNKIRSTKWGSLPFQSNLHC